MNEDDPTNNVSDAIFSKIGLQLHLRADHPLGILKDTIYEYFDKNMATKYKKFDDFLPIVSTKAVSRCLLDRYLVCYGPFVSHRSPKTGKNSGRFPFLRTKISALTSLNQILNISPFSASHSLHNRST